MKGWGAYDATGKQSRYLRQVELTLHEETTNCVCKKRYFLGTNVGPGGKDTCAGDSGKKLYLGSQNQHSSLCITLLEMSNMETFFLKEDHLCLRLRER